MARPGLTRLAESLAPVDRMTAAAALSELDGAGPVVKSIRVFWSLASSVIGLAVLLILGLAVTLFLVINRWPDRESPG